MTSLSDPAVQDNPFEYYSARHRSCPVWKEPDQNLHVVGSMEAARQVLVDSESFSNTPLSHRMGQNPVPAAYAAKMAERGWARASTLQRTDPPLHTRYRRVLNRVFTPAQVRKMTPGIDDIVTELIDSFIEAGRCEFVADFALPLPGMFIAEQLGLDRSQYKRFRSWADAMLCLANRPNMTMEEAMAEADIELDAQHHLAAEVAHRREQPGDDLISLIVHAHADEEPFSMQELQDLMHQLVTGGFETTTAGLAAAMYLLCTHPDQQRLLREHPDLLNNFVEESLRFDSPVQGLWRTTTCPVHVESPQGSIDVPEAHSVMVRYGMANRDPAAFDQPDRFDITRPDANQHIAFGLGAHFCLGAALARQELQSAFRQLIERTTWIELDGELPTPSHEPSFILRPMKALPIRFTR
jgi:cytochrome P450